MRLPSLRWPRKNKLPGEWPGQRILITGASGGIGMALAESLAQRGAHLLISGRQQYALASLVDRFPNHITAVSADLTNVSDRSRLVSAAQEAGCNMLINAAGSNQQGFFDTASDSDIEQLVAINLTATLQLTRALLPLLMAGPQATIITIGSTLGRLGYPGQVTYCATKFALRGFSQALRRELADTRVRVMYIAPRATRTAMNSPQTEALNAALGNTVDSPDAVALAIINAVEKQREELQIGLPERFFTRLNMLWPGAVDRALLRQLPVIRRFIAPQESSS
ncbi:SDR family oxidoreductase [Vreelandella maris]|uniref:SDR family oxidoreductase n=1 Tax=Vreelandella maris TaxID=2729617 RepID=A0A7Y6RBM5_9GAMM|nr:SDR family oxidoreductase [Halomonas maris]NVF13886.1 SDR family oxidoreductase [Halomonas maris]